VSDVERRKIQIVFGIRLLLVVVRERLEKGGRREIQQREGDIEQKGRERDREDIQQRERERQRVVGSSIDRPCPVCVSEVCEMEIKREFVCVCVCDRERENKRRKDKERCQNLQLWWLF
jgi:hypothetical protein